MQSRRRPDGLRAEGFVGWDARLQVQIRFSFRPCRRTLTLPIFGSCGPVEEAATKKSIQTDDDEDGDEMD